MDVSAEDVITAIHEAYQSQIRGLIDNFSMTAAANKSVQKENEELRAIVNALNDEVQTLRNAPVESTPLSVVD